MSKNCVRNKLCPSSRMFLTVVTAMYQVATTNLLHLEWGEGICLLFRDLLWGAMEDRLWHQGIYLWSLKDEKSQLLHIVKYETFYIFWLLTARMFSHPTPQSSAQNNWIWEPHSMIFTKHPRMWEQKKNIHKNLAMMTMMKMAITRTVFADHVGSIWPDSPITFIPCFPFLLPIIPLSKLYFPPILFPSGETCFCQSSLKKWARRGSD